MHVFFVQPLLAADFTHLAITLVVIFIAVMRQLFEASKQANKKRGSAPNLPDGRLQPQPGPPQPVQAGGQQADPLRNQVEEFLRRASQPPRPQDSGAKPQPRPASEIEILLQESRQALEKREPSGPRGADVRPIESPRPQRRKRRQTVAEHVAEQVASRSKTLTQKSSQLGQRIVAEDEQFDVQLKAKFDHTLGSLAGSVNPVAQPAAAPPADTPAWRIATLLANPEGVQQAMIVNEILRRPSERW